jgi:glutamate dehydrogenase
LRSRIEHLVVEATGASYWDQGIFMGHYNTMLAHIYLTGTHSLDEAALSSLVDQISQAATTWTDRLFEELVKAHGEEHGRKLFFEYGEAFEDIYQRTSSPERATKDIAHLESLATKDVAIVADLYLNAKGRLTVRLYQAENLILSEILPVLDHFGLVVTDQYHDPVSPSSGVPRNIDTFRLRRVEDLSDEAVLERAQLLVPALEAVFGGHTPDDVFNRVLLPAALPWQAVDMIRAYFGYARQLGLPYTAKRIQALLLARPKLLSTIWDYFQTRFDPEFKGHRKNKMRSLEDHVNDRIRAINNHDLDRVYRTLFNLLGSTLRTNFYRTDRPEHYISYKIDCSVVGHMPAPRLKYEIYVHHRDMEGVHLRGGSIARGGIRWSDRQDYRREILDLATTQRVKNVLIVPEGAKGGFYIKQPISDRAERRRRADELYQILIRGLLDVTDNVVDGAVVQPPGVVAHDDKDPYLVVAADKGTAHLSDTANGISRDYGFWLDDAFASGGCNGYDHKKVGITARGGWMTVRRLFRESGLEPDTDPFTVAGIGDTGGDVFGNGVIEHRTMKLVAAFNHLHIFFDPDPDPETSFEERSRLFREARGWDAYDTSLLSEGGGIFSRQSKSIQLTPQIQELLGVLKDELPVDTVIRLILRLNVDLLWNGGIGTYVKASHESHADAGDPSNDTVRVNASELRCKTVGEGGNLGFTQAARVEFALDGGDINTDFIDNSGGVDMSDHEVNLKILLNPMVQSGELSLKERNALLEKLTDQVASDVLNNNDNHARQLSLDVIRSERDPMWFSSAIDWACSRSQTSRLDLQLPSDDDLLRRVASRQGLTRPELATLQAHVKIHVYNALQTCEVDQLPGFEQMILDYFPSSVAKRWPEAITSHMLSQSIGATVLTNRIVGLSGSWFFPLVSELTGANIARIASAWLHAYVLLGGPEIHTALSNSPAPYQSRYRAWIMVSDAMLELVVGWCTAGEAGPDATQKERIKEVLQRIGRIAGAAKDDRLASRVQTLVSREIPPRLARRIARLGEVSIAREVALLNNGEESLGESLVRYLAVGEASRILPATRALTSRKSSGGWDPVATGILRYRYTCLLRSLIGVLPRDGDVRLGADRMAARLGLRRLRDLQELLDHILGDQPCVAALLVAEARVKAWTENFVA